MKLVRLAWVLALFQLPWGMHAQQPGNSSASASIALAIQEGLTRLNLTSAARLAVNASVSLIPKLSVPHPQTLLVPTNEAIAAAAPALASADNASIGAILSYHIINGTMSYKNVPDMFDNHIVAPTLLNDSSLTRLPAGATQVIVVKRRSSTTGIDILLPNGNNTFFNNTVDGPTLGALLIQPIQGLLIPPTNVSTTVSQIANLSTFSETIRMKELAPVLDGLRGMTIFAPVNEAFSGVAGAISSASDDDVDKVLLNHVLNGTILYSPQMPRSEDENGAASGDHAASKSKSNKTTSVITAGGLPLSLAYNKSVGALQVSISAGGTNGSITANIVRTDVLTDNGVIHHIDKVLLNTSDNSEAAGRVAGTDQAVLTIVKQEAPSLGTNATSPSGGTRNAATGVKHPTHGLYVPVACISAASLALSVGANFFNLH